MFYACVQNDVHVNLGINLFTLHTDVKRFTIKQVFNVLKYNAIDTI